MGGEVVSVVVTLVDAGRSRWQGLPTWDEVFLHVRPPKKALFSSRVGRGIDGGGSRTDTVSSSVGSQTNFGWEKSMSMIFTGLCYSSKVQ